MRRYEIQTGYIESLNITRFVLHYGPQLNLTKIVEVEGNLLVLDKDFELNKVLHKLKEISDHGE